MVLLAVQIVYLTFYLNFRLSEATIQNATNRLLNEHLISHKVLDKAGKFHLSWGPGHGKDIQFMVEVETLGYVAIGLSPNGGMTGSDIVTGWVRDGKVYFQDRYAEGNWMPRTDASQDWYLISGTENATHTIIMFYRNLETCDAEDISIDSGTMTLIYAYSDEDPNDEGSIPFHFSNRGTVSIMLLQPEVEKYPNLEGTKIWDVLSPNYTFSSMQPSIHWCSIVKIPVLGKTHVIMIEPLIQKGNEDCVHHLVLLACIGGDTEIFEEQLGQKGFECPDHYANETPLKCEGFFTSWNPGRKNLILPEHIGMPLDASVAVYYMLEVHYDNRYGYDGIQDHSGFRIYYTPQLRRYDAMTMLLGAFTDSFNVIPPGRSTYVISAHTNPECLTPFMPPEGIKILAVHPHAHSIGRRIKARHFRNGTELQPVVDDIHYDYNYQGLHYLNEEIHILPGDQLTVECYYDSSSRNTTTLVDLGTKEEMCLLSVVYYPRFEVFKVLSAPPGPIVARLIAGNEIANMADNETDKKTLDEYFMNFNWNETDIPLLESEIRYTAQNSYCFFGNGSSIPVQNLISYPKNLKEYMAVPSCVEKLNEDDKITSSGTSESTRNKNNLFHILLTSFLMAIALKMPA